MNYKNKKAQIPATLTWVIAFLIIFFVMILFLSSTIILAETKGIEVLKPLKYDSKVFDAQRDLIDYLNSPMKVDGEELRVLDSISSSLDYYFEIKNPNGQSLIDWAFKTYLSADSLEKIDFNQAESALFDRDELVEAGRRDREFAKELAKKLDSFCPDYYLQISQGVIRPGGLYTKKSIGYDIFDNSEERLMKWTPTADISIPYKNRIFEIKYRQLKEC